MHLFEKKFGSYTWLARNTWVGREANSFGTSRNGCIIWIEGKRFDGGPKFGKGDVVGCGLETTSGTAGCRMFFTMNGALG